MGNLSTKPWEKWCPCCECDCYDSCSGVRSTSANEQPVSRQPMQNLQPGYGQRHQTTDDYSWDHTINYLQAAAQEPRQGGYYDTNGL